MNLFVERKALLKLKKINTNFMHLVFKELKENVITKEVDLLEWENQQN